MLILWKYILGPTRKNASCSQCQRFVNGIKKCPIVTMRLHVFLQFSEKSCTRVSHKIFLKIKMSILHHTHCIYFYIFFKKSTVTILKFSQKNLKINHKNMHFGTAYFLSKLSKTSLHNLVKIP